MNNNLSKDRLACTWCPMALTEIVLQSTGQFWLLLELGLALTAVSGGGECPLGMPTAYE